MKYNKLVELYEKISSTTKRLEKIDYLSEFLEELKEEDSDAIYLLLGQIYPNYDGRKMGMSNQLAIKTIAKATGIANKKVLNEWKKTGDLGKVSENLIKNKKQTTLQQNNLTIKKIIENLRKLPELEGHGTVDKKLGLITELLTSATPKESLYIIRTLIGDLRIGIQESTIKSGIARAFFPDNENSEEIIQKAIDTSNDLKKVFLISKNKKIKELEEISLEIGKPSKVMLAQKAESISYAFEKLGTPCAIEYKYDGFRLIIHKKGNNVKLFTRKLEDVTKQFPEVVEYVKKYVKGNSFILDSEAIGYDKKTKKYLPFQGISQRIKRKYNIQKLSETLPVEVNVFDVLLYDEKITMNEIFEKRLKLVREIVKNEPYKIVPSKMIISNNKEDVENFYNKALENNQEGVIMKNLNAIYMPGKRVGYMLKIKPEQRDFDLVITGAEYGTGKRSGWLSSFTISCKKDDQFLEVGKMGTGIKEKSEQGVSFEELTKIAKPLIIEEKGKEVKIKPQIVISVGYQEIQKSPTYSSGFALRFPTLTALRPDRNSDDITTIREIEKEYEKQSGKN
jgi:DNA ligase-1